MQRPPSTPPELAGYEFVKLLGTGGFSDVFLYDQRLPRRRVAVKVLLLEEVTPASSAAFVDEANLMAQLSAHPYIVTIYHADVSVDGRPFFVMEYCSGPSLAERYKRERFAVDDALRTGIRLSSAIATAHAAGILHRDIKPANVLTNDFGWPALTDFGISSAVDLDLPVHTTTMAPSGEGTGGVTGSQSVGMSIPWSPAEMFEDDPEPDVRSDVFSLAATIHTLLAGRTPFEIPGRSNGTLDLIGRIERGAITPIDRDDIPRSLTAVLQKGMATRRSERFSSAADFARALQRVELELGYSQTNLEIPNLGLQSERADADGGADETRVRGVATIDAQPAVPAYIQPPAPPAGSEAETRVRPVTVVPPQRTAADEPTVVRGAIPAVDQTGIDQTVVRPVRVPEVVPPAPDEPADAPPASKRGRIVAIVTAAVVVVIGAVVAVALVTSGGTVRDQTRPTASASTGGGGAAIATDVVLAPTAPTAKRVGGSVTFSWTNPAPQDGDTYQYARSEQPGVAYPLAEPTVTLEVPAGARQCVDARIHRGGKTSDPLTVCSQ